MSIENYLENTKIFLVCRNIYILSRNVPSYSHLVYYFCLIVFYTSSLYISFEYSFLRQSILKCLFYIQNPISPTKISNYHYFLFSCSFPTQLLKSPIGGRYRPRCEILVQMVIKIARDQLVTISLLKTYCRESESLLLINKMYSLRITYKPLQHGEIFDNIP